MSQRLDQVNAAFLKDDAVSFADYSDQCSKIADKAVAKANNDARVARTAQRYVADRVFGAAIWRREPIERCMQLYRGVIDLGGVDVHKRFAWAAIFAKRLLTENQNELASAVLKPAISDLRSDPAAEEEEIRLLEVLLAQAK